MANPMNWLRSIVHSLWIGLTLVPCTTLVVLSSLVAPRAWSWRFAVWWFRSVVWGARVLLGVRVQVHGAEHLQATGGQAAVLLSKHQSALETLLLPTLIPHSLAYVFKKELLRYPLFGWSMACLDMIHIDRASRSEAMKSVITQGKRLLGQGTWIILFPEGTRVERGQRGTYQTAGTRLAIEAGVPVVPIAVTSAVCWPKSSFVMRPGVVHVSFGAPIASQGREGKELMREVEAWIESEMQRLDPAPYSVAQNNR